MQGPIELMLKPKFMGPIYKATLAHYFHKLDPHKAIGISKMKATQVRNTAGYNFGPFV